MHMRDSLSYSEYISDGRKTEKETILDFIVKQSSDCEHIVLMGDNFNSRNNSSETNRQFVNLLERFGSKEVYIISGNHEKKGDGKTAIDFIGEIKKENWHVFTSPGSISLITKHQSVGLSTSKQEPVFKMDFLPYMLNSELEVENNTEAINLIMKNLDGGDILFAHHSITGSSLKGIKTDLLNEIVLPREKLEKKYKLIVAGHIHEHQQYKRVLITGSVFTSEVGETEKFIWKIDDQIGIEKIKVPAREIHKLVDPTPLEITKLPKDSIAKIILTDKKIDPEEIKTVASGLDAYLLIEDYKDQRKKAHIEEGASFDFSIEALLKLYSEEKGVNLEKLLKGLELIK